MFNPRQLLGRALLVRAIVSAGVYTWETREYVLGAFQNFLRNQCMFAFWHATRDHFAPALSNNNYHPKSIAIEVGVFASVGYGPWSSTCSSIFEGRQWADNPWESVSVDSLRRIDPALAGEVSGKSERVYPGDILAVADMQQASSTDLSPLHDGQFDLVITDPPFGGLLHYSELSDFFYVWLRLVLQKDYPNLFGPEYVPKALEAVANRARQPENPDLFYQRILTDCWRETYRVLKPGGIL